MYVIFPYVRTEKKLFCLMHIQEITILFCLVHVQKIILLFGLMQVQKHHGIINAAHIISRNLLSVLYF